MKSGFKILFIFICAGCGSRTSTPPINNNQNYNQKVFSVKEVERANPKQFLKTSGTYHTNFLNTKIKIDAEITNTATVATYKDVILSLKFYSKTNTLIKTESHTFYTYFPPHETVNVTMEAKTNKSYGNVNWSVAGAKAAE